MSKSYNLTSHLFLPTKAEILTHFFGKSSKKFQYSLFGVGNTKAQKICRISKYFYNQLLLTEDIVFHPTLQSLTGSLLYLQNLLSERLRKMILTIDKFMPCLIHYAKNQTNMRKNIAIPGYE